jgi:hypothetical protein
MVGLLSNPATAFSAVAVFSPDSRLEIKLFL